MAADERIREVYSDQDFDLTRACVYCGMAVRREEDGRAIHPVLAVATADNGYDAGKAFTLCSYCLNDDALRLCLARAMDRSGDPYGLRYIYRVLGAPEQQQLILDVIRSLDQNPYE